MVAAWFAAKTPPAAGENWNYSVENTEWKVTE